jgi:hypothetical protein
MMAATAVSKMALGVLALEVLKMIALRVFRVTIALILVRINIALKMVKPKTTRKIMRAKIKLNIMPNAM